MGSLALAHGNGTVTGLQRAVKGIVLRKINRGGINWGGQGALRSRDEDTKANLAKLRQILGLLR